MTLTTNGKNWIAQNLGIGNCMTETEQSFTYRDSVNNINISDSGGTATILNRLVDDLCPYVTIGGTQHTYAALESANGGTEVTYPDDVVWVMNYDSGSEQYCVGTTPPPQTPNEGDLKCIGDDVYKYTSGSWVYDKYCPGGCVGGVCQPGGGGGTTETQPFEVDIVEGNACPAGAPDVSLNTNEAFAYFSADPIKHVGVMNIDVTNRDLSGDACYAYFTWEVRMWQGEAGTTCPTRTPDHQTISRYFQDTTAPKTISTKLVGTNKTVMIGASFEIPSHFVGKYTLCLTLWGNYNKKALLAELLSERGYVEDVAW